MHKSKILKRLRIGLLSTWKESSPFKTSWIAAWLMNWGKVTKSRVQSSSLRSRLTVDYSSTLTCSIASSLWKLVITCMSLLCVSLTSLTQAFVWTITSFWTVISTSASKASLQRLSHQLSCIRSSPLHSLTRHRSTISMQQIVWITSLSISE